MSWLIYEINISKNVHIHIVITRVLNREFTIEYNKIRNLQSKREFEIYKAIL